MRRPYLAAPRGVAARAASTLILSAGMLAALSAASFSRALPNTAQPPATARILPPTSTTSTTSTTLPMWPPPCGDTELNGRVTATDALYVLKTAVGSEACLVCLCDADGSGGITATDALYVLKYAVGLPVVMNCPACAPAVCGDDLVNQASEECDGLSDSACPGLCQTNCRCAQPSCGDGIVNQASEECDGTDDDRCPALCQAGCTCPAPVCGNDVAEQGEVCDGADPGGQTCATLGFAGGTLSCAAGCNGFDTTACDLPAELPPDPTSVASQIDPTVASDARSATEFLYTGSNPVQYGVLPETIEKRRAALLRGQVKQRDGSPLGGVEVRLLDHPELGATQTRADGYFDLVVNGGGLLTLVYEKPGYLKVQRRIKVPWQQYLTAPDVVLTPVDTRVETVDLTAPAAVQVARGSVVSDGRGTRQSTLVIPQGTGAELVLPDGATQALATLSIRQTEYTVGDTGPEAMPGELPFGVAYTYAVELSVDEAEAAGAESVQFDQPIYSYTENFLGFPTGEPVPNYFYDRVRGVWQREDDGVVIEIVSITGGLADVDADGDGVAEDQATLAGLGMTDAERTRLASDYAVGQTLWRVPVTHFSPRDHNWWPTLPTDAVDPPVPVPSVDTTNDDTNSCDAGGSIIMCQGQALGERLPVVGTPFTLNYRSTRVRGYVPGSAVKFKLTGDSPPGSLIDIRVVIDIAGRHEVHTLSPAPNLEFRYVWDGKDEFGRKLQGVQNLRVRLGYTYPGQYQCGGGGGGGAACPPAVPFTIWKDWNGPIGAWDVLGQGMGGWTLDVHHAYDPIADLLYLGSGERRYAGSKIIDTVVGAGGFSLDCGLRDDGEPATSIDIAATALTAAPDGSLIVGAGCGNIHLGYVWRIRPDGIAKVLVPTANGQSRPIVDLAVGPDGSIYVAESYRIRRIDASGAIRTVAGRTDMLEPWPLPSSPPADGTPAVGADMLVSSIAVGADGVLFIGDYWYGRVWRVDPSGTLTTYAGGGRDWDRDGKKATDLFLVGEDQLVVEIGPDGLYLAPDDRSQILRVDAEGIVHVVAGTDNPNVANLPSDGSSARQAFLGSVAGLAFGPDGSLYLCDSFDHRVFRIDPKGRITTLAGHGALGYYYSGGFGGDGGPAKAAELKRPAGVAVGPDGAVYIVDKGNDRVRRVSAPVPGGSAGELSYPSADGRLLYAFTEDGRHLRTTDALTATVLYTFGYDGNGLLTTITDADGGVTTIERDGSGNPTAIVAPHGQRTTLAVDVAGYLASVTNPAGETTAFGYSGEGLLATTTDAEGGVASFTYDVDGQLIRDDDAAGGYQTLARTELANGFEVTRATGSGATTTYRVEALPSGSTRLTTVFADAGQAGLLVRADATERTTLRDATTLDRSYARDPRFGMQAPIVDAQTFATPGGIQSSTAMTRTAQLASGADPLSLTSLTDVTSVAGQDYTRQFDATARTWTATSPSGRSVQASVDASGRPTSGRVGSYEAATFAYDSEGRLVSAVRGNGPNQQSFVLSYDGAGLLASVQDGSGRTSGFEYDAAGRLTRHTLTAAREIGYGYDRTGRITSITVPSGAVHRFGYTPIGLTATYIAPDAGDPSSSTTYTYDGDRRLTRIGRPDGSAVALSYDSGGRLQQIAAGSATIAYAYDGTTGHIASIATSQVTESRSYDGPLPTQFAWQGAVTGTVDVSYDSALRVASRSVNGETPVAISYDADGMLTGAGALTVTRDAQNGAVSGTTLGQVTDTRAYDSFGRLTSYRLSAGATELLSQTYSYDTLDRITQIVETIEGTTTTYDYAYDAAGNLSQVSEGGTVIASYAFDANGNRTQITTPGGGTITASYDAQDRLTNRGAASYTYSAAGYITSVTDGGQTTAYSYTPLGDLTDVVLPGGSQVHYVSDGLGRRVLETVDGTVRRGFLWADSGLQGPVAETDGAGQVVSRFVYATRPQVPDYMVRGSATYRIVTDHVGSVRLVVDAASGAVVQRLDYDPWGVVTQDTNPGFQPFGFAGGIFDPATELVRAGARDYEAASGRWTAKDPLGMAGGSTNLYAYASNDPIGASDPTGTQSGSPSTGGMCGGSGPMCIEPAWMCAQRCAEESVQRRRPSDQMLGRNRCYHDSPWVRCMSGCGLIGPTTNVGQRHPIINDLMRLIAPNPYNNSNFTPGNPQGNVHVGVRG